MTQPASCVAEALRAQAAQCAELGSPFGAAFLRAAADDPVAQRLLGPWADLDLARLLAAAVSLRLLGAAHDLVLDGDEPELAAAFPADDRSGEPESAWRRFAAAAERHEARLAAFLAHEPQTNEVGRSAALLPGFLEVATTTRRPLRLFELGASAGLNQVWDRFRYQADDWAWGDPASPVVLRPRWSGPPLPAAKVTVVSRAACDRRPVDLRDPDARRRLQAFVWADQRERLSRLQAAVELALAFGVTVDAADAVDWTRDRVRPEAGAATVLFHSVFQQYLAPAARAALFDVIERIGNLATDDAPFAWLRLEPAGEPLHGHEVRLTLWPGGRDRRLAVSHPHGAWVERLG